MKIRLRTLWGYTSDIQTSLFINRSQTTYKHDDLKVSWLSMRLQEVAPVVGLFTSVNYLQLYGIPCSLVNYARSLESAGRSQEIATS